MRLNAQQKKGIRMALIQVCVWAAAVSKEHGLRTQVLYGRGVYPSAIQVYGLYSHVIERQRLEGRRFRVLRTYVNGEEQ